MIKRMANTPKIMTVLPIIILLICALLLALDFGGYIELSGLLSNRGSSDNDFKEAGPSTGPDFEDITPSDTCPKTSCDTGVCCHSSEYDPTLKTNVAAYAVITYERCECPIDTDPEPIAIDRITPGGPYKTCKCI